MAFAYLPGFVERLLSALRFIKNDLRCHFKDDNKSYSGKEKVYLTPPLLLPWGQNKIQKKFSCHDS